MIHKKSLIELLFEETRKKKKSYIIKHLEGVEIPCKHDFSTMPKEFKHPQGLSGIIKRKEIAQGKGIMYYQITIGGKTFEGEFSGYGYSSRRIDDLGPFSMRLRREHPRIPMPLHEPQIAYAHASGDLKLIDV